VRWLAVTLIACGSDPLHYEPAPNDTHVIRRGTLVCREATVALEPAADTFLFEQYPDAAPGAQLEVFYSNQPGSRCYSLVRFDDLPEGDILGARFHFTTANTGKRVTASVVGPEWGESVTWSDLAESTEPFVEPPETEAVTVSGRSSIDIPTLWIEDWRSGARLNSGFMLRAPDVLVGFESFASGESDDPPTLVIDYLRCDVE
jgi:hypothetical protein